MCNDQKEKLISSEKIPYKKKIFSVFNMCNSEFFFLIMHQFIK